MSCVRLSEGAMAINVVRLAGTDLDESVRYNTQMEKAILAAFPDEVRHVWTRVGRMVGRLVAGREPDCTSGGRAGESVEAGRSGANAKV